MRFTSLVIELIRARPRLVVWLVVLLQAALWLFVPMLLYRSPPGDLATVLALGREYQVGTDLGPPLAFWLADIAFRAAGNHMFGVYLLAQLCSVAMFWVLYLLARAIVGGQQAVLAILLTMTVLAFSSPGRISNAVSMVLTPAFPALKRIDSIWSEPSFFSVTSREAKSLPPSRRVIFAREPA